MLSNTLDIVLKQWRAERIPLLLPLAEDEVITALKTTGRRVSRDVIELYCMTGGMNEGATDRYAWSLWPLEQIVTETTTYSRPYILFSDFLINSHLYCFKYEDEDASSVCIEWGDGKEPQQVAGNLKEFFELYLTKPEAVELYNF